MKKIFALILSAILFIGCNVEIKKDSIGNPYEVLVVCSEDFWNSSAGQALAMALDTDIPGLPQSEASFKVSRMSSESMNSTSSAFRNIILIEIDKNKYQKSEFNYVRNVAAEPQMVMSILSPSPEEFERFVTANTQVIIDFFTQVEMNYVVEELKKDYNQNAKNLVMDMFGCEILTPANIEGTKKGKDFLWISDFNVNKPEILNFVIYSYPYTSTDNFTMENFLAKRDSVMKENLPGGQPGQYIQTDHDFVEMNETTINGRYLQVVRGLWYMENDMMGGPFVSYSSVDEINNRVIVAEAFVYAPNKAKGNYMRKLEASLLTLKLPADRIIESSTLTEDIVIEAKENE